MEDALAQKYDRIQQFASRDWLGSSSASLARLEKIKAKVHNITPTSPKHLRPSSAYSFQKVYTELDTEPPLATKPLHSAAASAWGSNASVPELIKQQDERQSQRQASTKRSRRPWSGRKVPPSPTQGRPSSETGADAGESEAQRRLNAFMSVKGAKYEPRSRPPSGRGPRQTTGTALAELMVGLEEFSKQEVESTLMEFIRNQSSPGRHELARLSAAYGDHPSLMMPPPAPHGSPNPEERTIHDGQRETAIGQEGGDSVAEMDGDNEGAVYKEIAVKQPAVPKLLRRPTPEPVRLSMTIPGVSDDNSDHEEEDDYDLESDRSEDETQNTNPHVDLELQSVTSEVSAQIDQARADTTPVEHSHSDQVTPLGASLDKDALGRSRNRHAVQIAEERNITIDITPRDVFKPFVPKPPVEKRPQSAVTPSKTPSYGVDSSLSSASVHRGHVRQKSARPKSAKISVVGVEYENDLEKAKTEVLQVSDGTGFVKAKTEVETMMSRMSLSDDETDEVSKLPSGTNGVIRQVSHQSSFRRNYYELSRDISSSASEAAVLTTKTIHLGEDGPQEQKSVSVIKQASEPFRSALLRQDKKNEAEEQKGRSDSIAEEDARTHSAVRRPTKAKSTIVTAALCRPKSRMGHRQGDTDINITPGEAEESNIPQANTDTPPSTRPSLAPGRRHSGGLAVGRRSPGKMAVRRPLSAKPPAALDSTSKSCTKTSSVAFLKKRAVDYKRNREAVKALRDGTLNKEKKYTKQVVPVETVKPVTWKPQKSPSESTEDEEPQRVPLSAQEQEMEEMHLKLSERGINVSARTLARGLLPPTQRGYDDCTAELPAKSSLGLLNQPDAWLGKLFQKYKLAERALVIANERMASQMEAEAKKMPRGATKRRKKTARKRGGQHKGKSTIP